MKYYLTICGDKQSFVMAFKRMDFDTLIKTASVLVDHGLTIRIRKVEDGEG